MARPSRGTLQTFTDRLANFAGVERITGFSVQELMSLAMRRHSRDEVEQNFATGLPGFTPPLDKVVSDWPKPWMFVRLYLAASALFLGFVALFKVFHNTNLLPGMIMIGSFAVPLAVLVFFFETNTPRNVSLYTVMHAFLSGGLISLAISLLLLQYGASSNAWAGPATTAVLEEVGKILAVFLITMRTPGMRYPWILNGMLFGAAIGAGFAAFESAGYAFNTMLDRGKVDPAISVIILRGALAPFGHVIWTALVAGALWRVKRDRTLNPGMLVDPKVVRILALVIGLHALWDFPLPIPGVIKYSALGVLAWILVLGMITSGLKQIKATQASAARGGSILPQATAMQPTVPPVGSP
jgi:RsiW-degrading membrane proteinase PrsW (M82 family)